MKISIIKKIKLMSICFFVVFYLGTIGHAFAATYYVDDNTCPSVGSGTVGNPYCKIQSAANIVNPGDTVIVKDGNYNDLTQVGTYKEAVQIKRSGSAGAYITFKAENKWGAVIDGSASSLDSFGFVFYNNASYVKIENFEIKNFGWHGMQINANNKYITANGNYIHDIGRRCTNTVYGIVGISLGAESSYITITTNIINNIGRLTPAEQCSGALYYESNDHGIYVRGDNVTIINNTFYGHFSGWPIQVYSGDGRTIANLTISNNTFKDPQALPGHIILSANITNVTIQSNRFYNPTIAALKISSWSTMSNIKIYNNITTSSSMATNNFSIDFKDNILNSSLPQCADGIDNDNDGDIDYGTRSTNDRGCSSFQDDTEANDSLLGSSIPNIPNPPLLFLP